MGSQGGRKPDGSPVGMRIFVYALFLLVCLAVAVTGGSAAAEGLTGWYQGLAKPFFTPPDRLFAPVWTVLYVLIAVAGARFALAPEPEREPVLALYGVQLALNAAWPWIFFYGRALGAAAVVIAVLWLAILATIWLGWPKERIACWLLLPYLGWVGFAAVLNIAIWHLNG